MWCIPEASAAYVAAMEAVLDLYERPYQAEEPVVCFDETSKQLIAETRLPKPVQPGKPRRVDYEYRRNGTCNLFMFFEPLANYRHVEVTERRTKQDFARCMRWLTDEAYPTVRVIHVVLDNLNTHTAAALYETFAPAEARRILQRLQFHYTPKHGSWLNMAEIEFSICSRMCLNQRIPDAETLQHELLALETERNQKLATVNWQFTTEDARLKLKHLYPSYSE
jgi:transposase